MKAICIIGSPRTSGSSAFLVDKVIEGMKEENIEISRYCLGAMNINFCLGCKECHENGKCIQNDDISVIMNDLIESDIVLIASPSYWGDITGQLKVFFDRNTPYSDTNSNVNKVSIPQGKKGIAVAIRAGQSDRENLHILDSIEHYFGHLGILSIARFAVQGVNTLKDLKEKPEVIHKAYELGRNIKNLV